ncbi:hypothetical protein [Methanobacterium sp.]|uniref:hypothetical protein n=1 Tax=Methanobacterium sp. TaxID=2164 RepID=UPI003D660F84
MKDTIDIKTEDGEYRKQEKKALKRRKINKYGIYASLIFIAAGLIWYAVNLGLIPVDIIIKQAGPILIVIIGILILVKSI